MLTHGSSSMNCLHLFPFTVTANSQNNDTIANCDNEEIPRVWHLLRISETIKSH